MKHNIKTALWVFLHVLITYNSMGQPAGNRSNINCPEETIQVHVSHESIFTGEVCWFTIYCTSTLFPAEELSCLAFIELVSRENASIIRKKIMLKHGKGAGEFEVPENIPTGVYFILAYTNWMKNFGEQSFFRKEMMVVNPAQPIHITEDSLKYLKNQEVTKADNIVADKLSIIPDKEKYVTHERVNLKIKIPGFSGEAVPGRFSVSVYHKEPAMVFSTHKEIEAKRINEPEKIIYLPDYKGIRLSGKLLDPSDNPVAGAQVTLSEPGPGTDIQGDITDNNGDFHFLVKPLAGEKDIVITRPEAIAKIDLEESFWNGFRNPPDDLFFDFDQNVISYLEEKFMHYQLQKRFKQHPFVKNIPEISPEDSSVFYAKPFQFVEMDKFVMLDSLREYFYELIPSVKFVQRKGELTVSVVDPVTLTNIEDKPGVFLDGVLYNDYAAITAIPIEEIDRMTILPTTYYYKDFTFGGIIDIHTKKSDFNSISILPDMTRVLYPLADGCEWKFSAPDYSLTGTSDRIPDFRYLLHWEPNVSVDDSGEAFIHFYTGDITGSFIVRVVGMSDSGEIRLTENEIYVEGQ